MALELPTAPSIQGFLTSTRNAYSSNFKPSAQTINNVSDDQDNIRQVNMSGANSVVPTTFGQDRFFAKHIVAHVKDEELYLAYLVGDGEIEAYVKVYVDGVDVNDSQGFLSHSGAALNLYLGTSGQTTDPELSANIPGFSDTYADTAYIVIKLPAGSIQGIPRVEVEVKGKKIKRYDYASAFEETANSLGDRNSVRYSTDADNWGKENGASTNDTGTNIGPFNEIEVSGSVADARVVQIDQFNGYDPIIGTFYYKAGTSGRVRMYFLDQFDADSSIVGGTIGSLSVASASAGSLEILSDEDLGDYRVTKIKFNPGNAGHNFKVGIGPWRSSGTQNVVVYGMQVEDGGPVDDDTAVFTTNPVNILAHLMVEKAGWTVNEDSLREAAEWNNDVVPGEWWPRRSMGMTFDKPKALKSVIEAVRAYTSCAIAWDGGEAHLIPYKARSSSHTFDQDNIESIKLKKKRQSEIPTVVTVQWTRQNSEYERESITRKAAGVEAGTTPHRISRVNLYGCHNWGMARREAVERLNTGLSDLAASLVVYDEGLLAQIGDVCTVSHPIGLTNKLMYITGMSQRDAGIWELNVEEYDPLLFSTDVEDEPTYSDTDLPAHNAPPAPTGVSVVESLFQRATGEWESRLEVVWNAIVSPYITGYIIRFKIGTDLVATLQETGTKAVLTTVEEGASYTIEVTGVTTVYEGAAGTDTITPQGTQTPPGAPISISGQNTLGGDIRLSWGGSTTTGIMRYEVRYYTTAQSWNDGTVLEQVSGLTFTSKDDISDGTWRFGVKALSTVGIYSTTAQEIDITVDSALAEAGIISFYQTNFPNATKAGDLWYDTDDNLHPYRASAAGTGNWVSIRDGTIVLAQNDATQALADAATAIANAATAQGTADGKVTTYFAASAPVATAIGDLWVRSSDNLLYRSEGLGTGNWVPVQDDDIATAISDAATAQSTADGKIESWFQSNAPIAGAIGDIWIETDNANRPWRWSGDAWESIQDGDIATAQAAADGKSTIYRQPGEPTGAEAGDLWFDSDNGNLPHVYNGSVWDIAQDAEIADKQQKITIETTVQVNSFSAAKFYRYPCDTETNGAFTATLPGSPTAGDTVYFFDANGFFDVEPLTLARNGNNIMGDPDDMDIDIRYWSGGFQYINSTEGWVQV